MKNCPKIKKIAPVLALTLPLALSAVLGAFSTLKTAKADYGLPPADTGNVTDDVYISPFDSYNVLFTAYIATDNYYQVSSSNGFIYDNGYGVDNYNFLIRNNNDGNPRYSTYTVNKRFFDFEIEGESVGEYGYISAVLFNQRMTYCNEILFNYLYRNWRFNMTVDSYNYKQEFVFYVIENNELVEKTYTETKKVDNYNNSLQYELGVSWSTLRDLGYVTNDFVCIKSCYLEIAGFNNSWQNADFNVYRTGGLSDLDYISVFDYSVIQSNGFNTFVPYLYVEYPVDEIGLGVITNAVSEFLNTEFIPGFKLWYFLLIGLGCAITGIALKFFLGG